MTLEEEYENQQSWRTAPEKLTFIICEPLAKTNSTVPPKVEAKVVDADEHMIGDINFFIYQDDGSDDEGTEATGSKVALRGEIDVMIAQQGHQRQGYGSASVRALLMYLRRNMESILREYTAGLRIEEQVEMVGLMVKIKEGNTGSRRLFEKLGFEQSGNVNYFGEVMLVIEWGKIEELADEWLSSDELYKEVRYEQ